jgi:hypothetical protein
MKRQFWSGCLAALCISLFAVACEDSTTVAPKPGAAKGKPLFSATVPFNNNGVCMATDAANSGLTSGVNSESDLSDPTKNCTSNDVNVATAELTQVCTGPNFTNCVTVNPGQTITCDEGTTLQIGVRAHLEETASSARTDIGVWVSTDGGNARVGACNHYNLIATPGSGVTNEDSPPDECGDMASGATAILPLGNITTICQSSGSTTDVLHVGSCLGWQTPGQDGICPVPSLGETPNGFRYGTVPGDKSKCNCAGFDLNVIVHKHAFLEVVKACQPSTDNGTFDLLIDGSNQFADNVNCGGTTGKQQLDAGTNVNPGMNHTFGEGDFTTSAYNSSYACVNRTGGASRGSGTSLGPNTINLQPNDDVVCTYTNARIPQLTLVKRVVNDNGGTAVVGDFGITTNAGSLTFGAGVSDGTGTLKYTSNTFTLAAGTYSLHEDAKSGYTEGTWACTGASGAVVASASAGSVTIAAGDNAVCTITNDDQAPSLTIVKRIINDNGGTKVVGDFGITTTAGSLTFGSGVADGANTLKYTATTLTNLTAGSKTLHENAVTGYTEGAWGCTGGTGAVTTNAQTGSVVLNLGESVTCTITNDDQPASLQLIKRIVNANGGTAGVGSFGLTTTGGSLTFGSGVADGANTLKFTSTALSISAGTYTLHEGTFAGYTNGTWSCIGDATPINNNTAGSGSITVGNGETVVCTITNNDSPASLTIVKRIVNSHGGTASLGDFGITTTAGSLTFGSGVADGANTLKYTSSAVSVAAGTYNLHEGTLAGYTDGTWSCSGNSGAVTANAQTGSVGVSVGDAVTCTITNNDQPASLTLVKRIINDNGGTAVVGDFGLTTSAGSLTFDAGVADGANTLKYTATTLTGLSAGSKTLHEGTLTGYTDGTWNCSGGTGAVVSTASAGSVVLNNGESVTCTITNDDQPGSITVVKVLQGAGATFTYNTTSSTTTQLPSPITLVVPTDGTNSSVNGNLNAGTYSVTEQTLGGYTLTDLSCTGSFSQVYDASATSTASGITLPIGGSVTCTFTNVATPSATTRTQGFWATHSGLTNAVWFGGMSGGHTYPGIASHTLCPGGRVIDTEGKLLGGFWANIANTTTKVKRSALDQARMQLLQQLLAAILNNAAFNSVPTGGISIADAEAAYCGTDITAIKNAQAAMGAFNQGGDSGVFDPGSSANGKVAKDLANLVFWDVLP